MAYSEETDLLTGNIPTPAYLSPQKYINDAADEIDSKLGFIYKTPVDLATDAEHPVPRPVRLLLKRLNNFLATGRLLMAVDAGGERTQVHAYGKQLVDDALLTLNMIAEGKLELTDTPKLDGTDGELKVTAPLISNLDAESNVEAFYDRIANPEYIFFGTLPQGLIR
jgi:hypothetical protein